MEKIYTYALEKTFKKPTLILDLDKVKENFEVFKSNLPNFKIHYAIKANPNKEILKSLVSLGSNFDAASANEVKMCLAAGAHPSSISYGSTIKTIRDVKYAHKVGVNLFAADSIEEMEKLSTYAPNSNVFIRVLLGDTGAKRPLSKKFGCSPSMALSILEQSKPLNIKIVGLSFHIGSQTLHPQQWFESLDTISELWNNAKEHGHSMNLLNIGGGFPSEYDEAITDIPEYCRVLKNTITQKFGTVDHLIAEPGRAMVANCGIIAGEVILASKKDTTDSHRWLYLNIGRFGGLYSTDGEVFKYGLSIPNVSGELEEFIVAGPTLHSGDILYERYKPKLPSNVKSGDKILIHNTGAYTSVYSTQFNGFDKLKVIVLK